jgi:hypothetical protein
MACSAAELAVGLAVLAPVVSPWRVLYSNSGGFEGEAVDGGQYEVQWQAWRRPVPTCPTTPELL